MKYPELVLIMLLSVPFVTTFTPIAYDSAVMPNMFSNPYLTWNVIDSPEVPFDWGWSGQRSWIAEEESIISFEVTRIEEYVEGWFSIGNLSLQVNDTDIARELVLGVWGLTPFFPGLVVSVEENDLNQLNETAHKSAARVQGNYLNGTMESSFEDITIGPTTYDCIKFDYEQDSTGFGEPQRTELAYSLTTGVLVRANTSYSFGTPYSLVLELNSVARSLLPVAYIVGAVPILAIIGLIYLILRRIR